MYSFKLIAFAGLLLASQVLSANIAYSCKTTTGGISNTGTTIRKLGGTIPDEKVEEVLNDIGEWSDGKFTASQYARTGLVTVKCVNAVDTKTEATDNNNEAQQLINQHVGQT